MSYTADDIKRERRVESPVHPGRVLELEFLEPLGITAYRLAEDTGMKPQRAYSLICGKRGISADTAIRLGRYFGMSPQFFMNLQNRYDLELAERRISGEIEKIRPISA